MTPPPELLERIRAALPDAGEVVALVVDDDDRALAAALGAERDVRVLKARTQPAPRTETAAAVLVGAALTAPDHRELLEAARGLSSGSLVAAVRNAGHVDRRLAGLDLATPEAEAVVEDQAEETPEAEAAPEEPEEAPELPEVPEAEVAPGADEDGAQAAPPEEPVTESRADETAS